MNSLGDNMRNLEWHLFDYGSVDGAQAAVQGLIRLCDLSKTDSDALSQRIYTGLCLDDYDADAEAAS
jgi:hypothetical protein